MLDQSIFRVMCSPKTLIDPQRSSVIFLDANANMSDGGDSDASSNTDDVSWVFDDNGQEPADSDEGQVSAMPFCQNLFQRISTYFKDLFQV